MITTRHNVQFPFNISPPLQTVQYTYEKMTDEVIADRIYTCKEKQFPNPEYLFLSTQGLNELSAIAADYMPWSETHDNSAKENRETPKLAMFMGLHVVELPTLPDNVLLLGVLVLEEILIR